MKPPAAEVTDPPEPAAETATDGADTETDQADAVSADAGSPEAWEAPGAERPWIPRRPRCRADPGPDVSDGSGGDAGPAEPVGTSDETPTAAAMDLADAVSDDIGDTPSADVPEGEATPSSSSAE